MLDPTGARVEGVSTERGTELAAQVVLATGAWSGLLEGLPQQARVPVRPVKGQVLRLRDPAGPGLVRGAVRCQGAYLVPRDDGGYALGASVEERGFELAARDARHTSCCAPRTTRPGRLRAAPGGGVRGVAPGLARQHSDHRAAACEGMVWATGHYRNGILLAPLTAELLAGLLAGEDEDPMLRTCDPARFAAVASGDRARAAVTA